jgi:hypothetical protein
MHALRLGYQGLELLTKRNISLPVQEPKLSELCAVRAGQYSYEKVLKLIEDVETELKYQVDDCLHQADFDLVNKIMVDAHLLHWRETCPRLQK